MVGDLSIIDIKNASATLLSQYGTIDLSGVRALPLGVAAERSVHYIWYYFTFLLSLPHTFLLEGVVLML